MERDGDGGRVAAWLAILGVVATALVGCANGLDLDSLRSLPPTPTLESSQPAPAGDPSTNPSTEQSSQAPSTADLVDGIQWSGTFTMTVEIWNYCGSAPGELELSLADTYTQDESFSFSAAAPIEVSDARSRTPVLHVRRHRSRRSRPTHLGLFSAALLTVTEHAR